MLSPALLVSLVPSLFLVLSVQGAPHAFLRRDAMNSTTQGSTSTIATGSIQPLSTIYYGGASTSTSSSTSEYPEPTDMSAPEGIFFIPPDVVSSQSSSSTAEAAASPSSSSSPSSNSDPKLQSADSTSNSTSNSNSNSTSSTTPPPAPAPAPPTPPTPLIMAYYPDWVGSTFPPESIDFTRYDWIDFAFALPDKEFNLTWDNVEDSPDLLRRLVGAAHGKGKKVKLSVGGWTGSRHFSPAMATPSSRHTFASNILTTYTTYNLDGIDIDWEYPGHPGEDGNKSSPDDSDNFLAFLRLLREYLPDDAKLSAATQTTPFVGTDGEPMRDVRAFAGVLDWILVMNYDVWDSSSTPGPNAPFYNACQNSSQPLANAVAAYTSWTAAGFPAAQMVLGVPSYGYLSSSDAEGLRTRGVRGGGGSGGFGRGGGGVFGRGRGGRRRVVAVSNSGESESSGSAIGSISATGSSSTSGSGSTTGSGSTIVSGSTIDSSSAPSSSFTLGSSSGTSPPPSTPSISAPTSSSTSDPSSDSDPSPTATPTSTDTPSPSPPPSHSNGTSTQGQDQGPVNITVTSSDPQIQFRELVRQGALVFTPDAPSNSTSPSPSSSNTSNSNTTSNTTKPKGTYTASSGYTRHWDPCSSTPYLHSPSARQIITYDDPESLALKARFARRVGMLGVNLFDVHGDTEGWELVDGVRGGLGVGRVGG